MLPSKKAYKWFYDHIHSCYYDLLTKWCFLPFGAEARCREQLIAHIDFGPKEVILDMCCGTGAATCSILRKAGGHSKIIGMDLSSGQIRAAAKRAELEGVRFVEADAACPAFREGVFDKVFITHALHEMSRESRLQVLAESRRILKENGKVIVLEMDDPQNFLDRFFIAFWFFYWFPFNFETPTRRDMLRHGLTEEVKEAGFTHVTKTSQYRGIFQVVEGIKQVKMAADGSLPLR
jgi:demethylmenaquinone methyltransferase/2-methoxy-6-polyprenyl-1,4-benzoquinol methylase